MINAAIVGLGWWGKHIIGSLAESDKIGIVLAVDVDVDKAREFAASTEAQAELARNTDLARQIGFGGTPSWVIGGQAFEGAIGLDALQEAIDAAKAK